MLCLYRSVQDMLDLLSVPFSLVVTLCSPDHICKAKGATLLLRVSPDQVQILIGIDQH